MLTGLIMWIILGALAGWIASLIMGVDDRLGGVGNIIVGIIGAVLGGWIMQALGGNGVTGFNLYSILVAIGGAVVLLALVRLFTGGAARAGRDIH